MWGYEIGIVVHVLTAILGVGQVAGLTVVAAAARRNSAVASETWAALTRLARGAGWSLGVMLLSGLYLEYLAGWSHGRTWWLRISFLLFLACGAVLGMTRGLLRKGAAAGDGAVLAGVVTRSGVVCAMVAVIAALMQLKPW